MTRIFSWGGFVFFVVFLGVGIFPALSYAAAPAGFSLQTVVGGLNIPTALSFAPDGRIFVAEKDGVVRIIKDTVLLPDPFITLPAINAAGDRGLLGIVLDPNFGSNGYVYLAYTHENDASNPDGKKTGRIVRVTANGDAAVAGSMIILVGSVSGTPEAPSCSDYATTSDCIRSDSLSHSTGGLRFGPDGKLYAALGDGAGYDSVDPEAYHAQVIDALAGKILRINRDGTAPSDNAFYNGDPHANRSKIYAYGVRNPFRFNFHPDGTLYFGDVGWYTFEEINRGVAGANYGWPCREGAADAPGYDCIAEGNVQDPVHNAPHGGGSSAIVGGAFMGAAYPIEYNNHYLFGNFATNQMFHARLDTAGNFASVEEWYGNAGGPVEFLTAPDGTVYYLAIYTGEIRKVVYSENNAPMVAFTASPSFGPVPLLVSFSSASSSDPDGETLTYAWDFGDGGSSIEANHTHTYSASGRFTAALTVTDTRGARATKTETIYAGEYVPQNAYFVQYFADTSATGTPVHVVEEGQVNFNWQAGSPQGNVPTDGFSARARGMVGFAPGAYTFHLYADNGVRLFIDGVPLIDFWHPQFITHHEATTTLAAGLHDVLIEYFHVNENASLALLSDRTGSSASSTDPEPHFIAATKTPASPSLGQPVHFTVRIGNAGAPEPVLVDFEIYRADGTKAYQTFFDNEVIATGGEKTYTFTWQADQTGIHRLAVGLVAAGWSGGLYQWTNEAMLFDVTERFPDMTHASTTISNPQPLVGATTTITTNITNIGSMGDALIDIEIYHNNEKIAQKFFDNQHFLPNETRSFTFEWVPPHAGEFGIAIGIFQPGWNGLYEWNSHVGQIVALDTPPSSSDPIFVYTATSLNPGWANWSWNTTTNFGATSTPAAADGSALFVAFTETWGGLYLRANAVSVVGKTNLVFDISGGETGGQKLQIRALDAAGSALPQKLLSDYLPAILPNTWHTVTIPLTDLGLATETTGLILQGSSGLIESIFYLDTIRFE